MINMISLFPKSIEPEKVEEILTNLISSMKEAEGLVSIVKSDGHLMSPGGPPAYSIVLLATWRSLENMMAWTQTPGAHNEDKDFLLANGGVLLFYEVKEI